MIQRDELIQIGYVRRPHGFKGNIQLKLDKEVALSQGDFFFLELDGQLIPFQLLSGVEQMEPVVSLKFVEDFPTAESLIGAAIYVEKAGLDSEDGYPFIGFMVEDQALGTLGPIVDFEPYPQQMMMVVNHQDSEQLIPWVDAFILEIDEQNEIIKVNLPEGLLDL